MTKITKENMQNAHDELLQTFVDKNADYGNSFESSLEEYGLIAALIRMEDKMGRLRTLIKSEAKVKDESISDTLRDLSNYALMASVWFDHMNDSKDELDEQIEDLNQKLIDHLTELGDPNNENERMAKLFPNTGYYSGIKVFKPGEKTVFFEQDIKEPSNEIEIQNKEQLRLFLNIHKDAGAAGLVKAIGRDIFYKIDFADFLRYVKELRGVEFKDSDRLEIYFNVRNNDLNKVIYVKTNTLFSKYVFPNIEDFEAALNTFIDFKKCLLDKLPNNMKSLIQANVKKQRSKILKPRTRIDDSFMDLVLYYSDRIEYFKDDVVRSKVHKENGETITYKYSSDEELLTRSFIYDMYEEGTTNPDHGYYHLVITDGKLTMASSVEAALQTFLSNSFLDSFQRVLDSGKKVKIINIPQ
jgi:hypothetical protein